MSISQTTDIESILLCKTSESWCHTAVENLDLLLIDHAHCERKAAGNALHFIHSYPHYEVLVHRLSRLAREELRHFEQVVSLLKRREIMYRGLAPSRYAVGLREFIRPIDDVSGGRLVDLLIISAFIEARSCERFSALLPFLDEELASFYRGLAAAESRHFKLYLDLANLYSESPIDDRIAFFAEKERELIEAPDKQLRFHSGVPELNYTLRSK